MISLSSAILMISRRLTCTATIRHMVAFRGYITPLRELRACFDFEC